MSNVGARFSSTKDTVRLPDRKKSTWRSVRICFRCGGNWDAEWDRWRKRAVR
jgi:hypothetical protein